MWVSGRTSSMSPASSSSITSGVVECRRLPAPRVPSCPPRPRAGSSAACPGPRRTRGRKNHDLPVLAALRPLTPKAFRSPHTSCTRPSGVTRPRVRLRSEVITSPVWEGRFWVPSRSAAALWPAAKSAPTWSLAATSSQMPVHPEEFASSARNPRRQADRARLDPQRQVFGGDSGVAE